MSEIKYSEKIQSTGTSLLFLCLSALCFLLFFWRISIVGWRFFPGLWLGLGILFLFYTINYRVLKIELTEKYLSLRFGIVPWRSKYDNILSIQMDDSPAIIKYGGAGVHFAFVNGKYRAFYNFLEFPRLLISFKQKQGLVQELVFTTRQPERMIEVIQSLMSEQ
jgi:hypothetical protein